MKLIGRKSCAGGLCLVGLAVLVCGLTNAEPRWPQYGFDARHTLFNPLERTLNRSNVADLSLQWEYMTGNGTGIAPLSGPALADGVLYVGSYAETTFRAFDTATGAIRWSYTGLNFFSDPAVGGGHVYTASLDGNLYAFPTNCVGTCTPTWAVPVGTLGTNSPPTFSNGKRWAANLFPVCRLAPPTWACMSQHNLSGTHRGYHRAKQCKRARHQQRDQKRS